MVSHHRSARSRRSPARRRLNGAGCALARDLPLLPLAILVPFVLIAVFANLIAPYDPTEPIPRREDLRAALLVGRAAARTRCSAPISRPRRAEPADLRRPRVADRRRDGHRRRRRHRHRARHARRLSRRLGRPGHHARHRRMARLAGAGLRDLSGDDGRAQHVEHRHHPGAASTGRATPG